MDIIIQQLLSILVAPPGNLIYHLTLAFAVFASLQVALISRRAGTGGLPAGRSLLGLNMLLIAQLALFLSSGLAWQGVVDPHTFLPIFDRAVILLSLIWIGWLWAFPTPSRAADIVTGLLNLAVVVLFLFTYTQWLLEEGALPFNSSWEDWTWALTSLGVVVVVIVLLLFRRPENWGIGVGMMALNLAGLLAHLFLAPTGDDFSGYIRVAQLASFPLLPSLLVRAPKQESSTALPAESQPSQTSSRSMDLRAVHAWLDLSLQTEPEKTCAAVARAVAQTMQADLCLVMSAPASSASPVIVQGGYDSLREEDLPGSILDQASIPALSNALAKGKHMRIIATETQPPDLTGLGIALGLTEVGNVLLIPLLQNGVPWGGLVLLSPYSKRIWSTDDQNFFSSETEPMVRLLKHNQNLTDHKGDIDQFKASLSALGMELNDLRRENQDLTLELEKLHQAAGRPPDGILSAARSQTSADLESLLALQRESQDAITSLQVENARLKAQIEQPDDGNSDVLARFEILKPGREMIAQAGKLGDGDEQQMENELRATLEEVARLQNMLASSNIRSLELERKLNQSVNLTPEDHEVISSIVQELRQPMASVMGYTDLLLGETVGILGNLQRKFLERVRAATERLRGLMDDLIQVTSVGSDTLELIQQPVDVSMVIDAAITDVSARMREKNINLRIEIPDDLPLLSADREGLQQIIGQLLQNASLVTPVDGTVSLRAGLKKEDNSDYLILQVTDEGGGISAEDLPNVFNRRFRADNVLIQGVGDTGVGLSIARSLVEAHGGRIWVESTPGFSSTFSVLLPVRPTPAKEAAGK